MKKIRRRNIIGMLVYMTIAFTFGGGFGLLALIMKEDNDRCHYYNGAWNVGDLIRGLISISIGIFISKTFNIKII